MYENFSPNNRYDPAKAHAYYERTKHLKGRTKSSKSSSSKKTTVSKAQGKPAVKLSPKAQKIQARIGRLRSKIKKLRGALTEAEAALSNKRTKATAAKKASSDGKTTAKERQASQDYRDKHQAQIKAKQKSSSSSASSSGSSKSSSNSVSDLNDQQLRARIIKIKGVLREANRQLAVASQELGHLAHTAITSEPNVNEHFAHFQSAERIPSQ